MFAIKDDTIAAKLLIKTHYIMKVVEFHPDDQTVDLIQETFGFTNTPYGKMTVTNDFGQSIVAALTYPDNLIGVPVKQLRWGQFAIQCCPVPGDTGYIEVFTDDIREWVKNGGPAVPWSDRRFIKESCVFVPFVPNNKNADADYPSDNSQLIIKSANASIVITDKPAQEGSEEEPTVDITTTAQTMNINAEKGITVNGDINITGNITVTGDITASGNITSTDGDVVAGEISLKNHTHDGSTLTTTATVGTGGPGTISGNTGVAK